jgi:hypothetical protein
MFAHSWYKRIEIMVQCWLKAMTETSRQPFVVQRARGWCEARTASYRISLLSRSVNEIEHVELKIEKSS